MQVFVTILMQNVEVCQNRDRCNWHLGWYQRWLRLGLKLETKYSSVNSIFPIEVVQLNIQSDLKCENVTAIMKIRADTINKKIESVHAGDRLQQNTLFSILTSKNF